MNICIFLSAKIYFASSNPCGAPRVKERTPFIRSKAPLSFFRNPSQTYPDKESLFCKNICSGRERSRLFPPLSLSSISSQSVARAFQVLFIDVRVAGLVVGLLFRDIGKGRGREGQKAFPANCALSLTEKERLRGGFPLTSLNAVMPSVFVNVGCGCVILCRTQSRWGEKERLSFLGLHPFAKFFLLPPSCLSPMSLRSRIRTHSAVFVCALFGTL